MFSQAEIKAKSKEIADKICKEYHEKFSQKLTELKKEKAQRAAAGGN